MKVLIFAMINVLVGGFVIAIILTRRCVNVPRIDMTLNPRFGVFLVLKNINGSDDLNEN